MNEIKTYDIGIRCDYLLTMNEAFNDHKKPLIVHRDYFVGINGNKIAEVAPYKEGLFQSKNLIHAKNHLVMPSLVNGHTHLPMAPMRGLADDLPFNDWLYKYILPLEAKMVSEDYVRAATELAALESIRFGVTTFCDMYYFQNIVADTLDLAGLRGVCCEATIDFAAPDNPAGGGNNYKILDQMLERHRGHDRITVGIAPHAPYSCSLETLRRAYAYAEKHDLPVHIHVSETKNEIKESYALHGKSPIQYLNNLGIMSDRTIFAHCVHLDDEDIRILAQTKTAVIYNPESNMKVGCGVAPIPALLNAGVVVGIGTDGVASNNDLSILREIDTGTKVQKLVCEDNIAMTADQAVKFATSFGARALGLEKVTGSIAVNKFADIILLDLNQPHMRPIYSIPSLLTYSATGLEVDTVICHGKILYENGKHTTLDSGLIFDKMEFYKKKIDEHLAS